MFTLRYKIKSITIHIHQTTTPSCAAQELTKTESLVVVSTCERNCRNFSGLQTKTNNQTTRNSFHLTNENFYDRRYNGIIMHL